MYFSSTNLKTWLRAWWHELQPHSICLSIPNRTHSTLKMMFSTKLAWTSPIRGCRPARRPPLRVSLQFAHDPNRSRETCANVVHFTPAIPGSNSACHYCLVERDFDLFSARQRCCVVRQCNTQKIFGRLQDCGVPVHKEKRSSILATTSGQQQKQAYDSRNRVRPNSPHVW